MSNAALSQPSIPYAMTASSRRSVWAGAAIIAGGLGLVFFGGCFLIGAMLTINRDAMAIQLAPQQPLTGPQVFFVASMYVLALVCFVGAATMLFVGTRSLVRLLHA